MNTDAFIRALRAAVAGKYDRLDLRWMTPELAQHAHGLDAAPLDEIYEPLRFREGTDFRAPGILIQPEELLTRRTPLVIRGVSGSGKTTWMRFTFGKLAAMDRALPFYVELGRLAGRSISSYLPTWVEEAGIRGGEEALAAVLASETGPLPVLLLDGWDELGDVEEARRAEVEHIRGKYPRMIVVIATRPRATVYGEGDGVVLSDIHFNHPSLAKRFFARLPGAPTNAAREFVVMQKTWCATASMAHTPLLFTVMLLLGPSLTMQEQRHRMYDACLRALLAMRPGDGVARFCVMAELSFRMWSAGYRSWSPWNDSERNAFLDMISSFLPEGWTVGQRRDFLDWLASVGMIRLVEHDKFPWTFRHPCLYEYLTAIHLAEMLEGPESRIALCNEWKRDWRSWEPLRLWAALVEERSPRDLEPVLKSLIEGDSAGFWLASVMFADGLGGGLFDAFLERLPGHCHVGEEEYASRTMDAWFDCNQGARKAQMDRVLSGAESRWLLALREWMPPTAPEKSGMSPRWASEAGEGQGVGRGRVGCAASSIWPVDPEELVVLRLWPGHRPQAAMRLQTLISVGGARALREVGRSVLVPPEETAALRDWARELAPRLSFPGSRARARHLAAEFSRYAARYLVSAFGLARPPVWMQDWLPLLVKDLRDCARDWAYTSSDWTRDAALQQAQRAFKARSGRVRDGVEAWGLPKDEAWSMDWAAIELVSFHRIGTRVALAHSSDLPTRTLRLFQEASRASLDPQFNHRYLERPLPAPRRSDDDPLWPALARHISRRSTPEDRDLLEDLARNPEKRGPPLSWGLKYYVRGDLVLDDGSEITLDALCDELGLPRLPYLVDMEPELEIEWTGMRS